MIPSQKFVFLGARYDLIQFLIYPTVVNWDKVQKSVHLYFNNSHLTALQFQSIIGVLMSQSSLVDYGRLHVRQRQFNLHSQWNQCRDDPFTLIRVHSEAVKSARWWTQTSLRLEGVSVVPPLYTVRVFTDACLVG